MTAGILCGKLYSQINQLKYSRQTAIEAFSKNDYEQALMEFDRLMQDFSKDPLYKYYSGVCRVKLNRNIDQASILLQEALKGAEVVRPVPSDGWFYLGRAQQMSGNYSEAIKSYRLFTERSGKKVSDELNISEYIKQCKEGKGKFNESGPEIAVTTVKSTIDIYTSEAKPDLNEATSEDTEHLDENSRSKMDTVPDEYDKILAEAIEYQIKADSLNIIAARERKNLEKIPDNRKAEMESNISETESMATSYQKRADQKYNQAQDSFGEKTSAQDAEQTIMPNVNTSDPEPETSPTILRDTKPSQPQAKDNTKELFSIFKIIAKFPTSDNEKIEIDPDLPSGLIYRIQLAVFRNLVSPSVFKGIIPVYGIKVAGTDKTNYYAGIFRRVADARKSLDQIVCHEEYE